VFFNWKQVKGSKKKETCIARPDSRQAGGRREKGAISGKFSQGATLGGKRQTVVIFLTELKEGKGQQRNISLGNKDNPTEGNLADRIIQGGAKNREYNHHS